MIEAHILHTVIIHLRTSPRPQVHLLRWWRTHRL